MYLRSPYPPPSPPPSTNFHNVVWQGQGHEEIPDHVMQIDAAIGQKRTRAEFIERMYDGATALGTSKQAGGLGFTSNDIVGILSENCLDYIVLVHSLLVITTPFALFSTYATPREMSHSLTKSKSNHIFVHASLLLRFLPVAREHGFPEDNIYILEGLLHADMRFASFGQMIEKIRYDRIPRVPVREAGKDTLAYLVFSSGTSGLPKAVMISHGNLISAQFQAAIVFEELYKILNPPESLTSIPIVLSFLPFFHTYGLHSTIIRAPLHPATHIVMPRWNINMALDLISRYRVTTLPSIPSIIHQLVNSPQFAKMDLSSITSIGSGAAYLPRKLFERLKSLIPMSVALHDGYGMSEATISIILRPQPGLLGGRVEAVSESSGILIPGVEALILRPDGTHCVPGEPGELYIKGGNVALGYWNNLEATKETFIGNGWLRTGDIFRANSKGTFWFEDRAKDTLKVSGLQVSPAEIEDVLLAEPNGLVNDAAVVGVQIPGARTSDDRAPRAWVVLSEQGRRMHEDEARAALDKWARENLSKYKWLRGGIQFVQEVPKSATGKVLRRLLHDQYASGTSTSYKL